MILLENLSVFQRWLWSGHISTKPYGFFDPAFGGIVGAGQGFFRGLTIRHAAGKLGDKGNIPAAKFFSQRPHINFVVVSAHDSLPTTDSMNLTSFKIYTALIGLWAGIVKISA